MSRIAGGAAVTAAMVLASTAVSVAQDVRIAVAGPFTGQLAALGEQLKRGAEQFVADRNAEGGIDGHRLVLDEGDDQCDPKQAVAVANRFVADGDIVVIGHACSGSSIPASDVYAEAGVLEITPSSTNPAFTERGRENTFRIVGRDDQQGGFAGRYIAEHFKGDRLAIVQDKSAYGRGLADQAKVTLNQLGMRETMFEGINAGEKDFSALITKMKATDIKMVYYGGYHPEAALIMRQAMAQGLPLQLIGGDTLNTVEFSAIAGPAGEGTLFSSVPAARELPEGRSLAERFEAQGYDPEGYTLYTYAAFEVWAQAVEAAKSFRLDALVKPLHTRSFKTVIGVLQFDNKGDLKDPKLVMYRWQGGKAVAERN